MDLQQLLALIDQLLTNPDATIEEMGAALTQVRDALAAMVEDGGGEEPPAEGAGAEGAVELSADDVEKVTQLAAKFEQLKTKLEKKTAAVETLKKIASDSTVYKTPVNKLPNNTQQKQMVVPAEVRRVKSRYFKSNEDAYTTGQFLRAMRGQKDAETWMHDRGFEFKTLTSANNASAGILVPDVWDDAILKLREQRGVARQLARVVSMSSETYKTRRLVSGTSGYFIIEGTAITSSDPVYANLTLSTKLVGVSTKFNQTLSDDAIVNLVDELTEEHAYSHADKEDEAYFNGDGTSTYGGIVGVRNVWELQTVANGGTFATDGDKDNNAGLLLATGTTWGSITDDDINKLKARVRNDNNARNRFVCSNQFYHEVMQVIAINAGGTTANEIIDGVERPTFLGVPVFISNSMPRVTATSQVCLLYGDFSIGSLFGDRVGITVETDKNISTQQTEIVTTARWDALVHDYGNYNATATNWTFGSIAALCTQAD